LLGQLTEGDLEKSLGVENIFWRWGDCVGLAGWLSERGEGGREEEGA
jgi:hypothetical protein